MQIDLERTPFSRYGSYITVVERRNPASEGKSGGFGSGVWLSSVHGFNAARDTFRIALWDEGAEVPFEVEVHASHLVLRAAVGSVELCLAGPELVRMRSRGVTLRLMLAEHKYNYVVPQGGSRWLVNTAQAFVLYTVDALAGNFRVESERHRSIPSGMVLELSTSEANGEAELALHPHVGFADPPAVTGSFDAAVSGVAAEFEAFVAPYQQAAGGEWEETVRQAAWLNWSCVVAPRGHFKRPSMLMSNNGMANVWAWDHAINALALAQAHPQLAWDQMLTIFDHQLETGQLPDFINDAVRLYNYIKPPIHGWILSRMLERNPWFGDWLGEIYEPLARWTEWWCRFRLNDGLPVVYHGNDTGWDNATVFDAGVPAVSCDIAAFLVLQMEMLARIAKQLGQDAAATAWDQRSQQMRDRLIEQLWTGQRFAVRPTEEASNSVFGALPLILGKRLPPEIREVLVREVRRHLTEWGLATEHPSSPLYEPDGYWRGPIWAPPTLILVEALRAIGENGLAEDIAARFCRLCARSGFAENFNALTGAPLCDPAYTWTSSVFLYLRAAICEPEKKRKRP